MIADLSSVEPQHVKDVLIIAFAVASLVIGLLMYLKRGRTEIAPQPLEVRGSGPTTTELDKRVIALERSFEQLRSELRADRDKLDDADEARASRLHARIDSLRNDMENKLQNLPAQIIALLQNTGVIRRSERP